MKTLDLEIRRKLQPDVLREYAHSTAKAITIRE